MVMAVEVVSYTPLGKLYQSTLNCITNMICLYAWMQAGIVLMHKYIIIKDFFKQKNFSFGDVRSFIAMIIRRLFSFVLSCVAHANYGFDSFNTMKFKSNIIIQIHLVITYCIRFNITKLRFFFN